MGQVQLRTSQLVKLLRADINNPMVHARVQRVAAQAMNHVTWTSFSFDNEEIDTASLWAAGSPTLITIPRTGLYLLTATVYCDANASTNERGGQFLLNGATVIEKIYFNNVPNTGPHSCLSTTKMLAATNTIALQGYHALGGAVNFYGTLTVSLLTEGR